MVPRGSTHFTDTTRHWGTLNHRKFAGPSTATRWQAIQEYLRDWSLVRLLKINNHLHTFSAVRAYEEVVRVESNRHGGVERNWHGWSDYRLCSLQALRGGSAESSIRLITPPASKPRQLFKGYGRRFGRLADVLMPSIALYSPRDEGGCNRTAFRLWQAAFRYNEDGDQS